LNELTPQKTIHTLSFYTSISGRLSSQLLDFSKKIEQNYGYVVQPYPESSKSLSQGYVLNVEARLRLPNFFEYEVGELNLISFIETAAMTQSTSTWIDGMNPSAFTGAGIGILLSYESHHEVKAYLVHKTGNEVAVSAQSSSNKIAIQARKYF
jgi:hemolysin activation/secretion protein